MSIPAARDCVGGHVTARDLRYRVPARWLIGHSAAAPIDDYVVRFAPNLPPSLFIDDRAFVVFSYFKAFGIPPSF